jgi:tRNA threonylcarbamoyladenosine biosynthesis protein TsaE
MDSSNSRTERVTSKENMQRVAHEYAASCQPGDVLLLTGELGAGKTTFVQGLAQALGITEPLTSPTFTLMSEYPVPQPHAVAALVHIDLWRLTPDEAQREGAIIDTLKKAPASQQLVAVEWADRLGEATPVHAYPPGRRARHLAFAHGAAPEERIITMAR